MRIQYIFFLSSYVIIVAAVKLVFKNMRATTSSKKNDATRMETETSREIVIEESNKQRDGLSSFGWETHPECKKSFLLFSVTISLCLLLFVACSNNNIFLIDICTYWYVLDKSRLSY